MNFKAFLPMLLAMVMGTGVGCAPVDGEDDGEQVEASHDEVREVISGPLQFSKGSRPAGTGLQTSPACSCCAVATSERPSLHFTSKRPSLRCVIDAAS